MSAEPGTVRITLSPAQVEEVVRAASRSRSPTIAALISDALAAPGEGEPPVGAADTGGPSPRAARIALEAADPRMSRSLLRGLAILTRFGPDGRERGIVELAGELGMSPSTTHRYAQTLVQLGLLEHSPRTRKYRLPAR